MENNPNKQCIWTSHDLTRRDFLAQSGRLSLVAGMALYGPRVWAREHVIERPQDTGIWSSTGATGILGKPAVYRGGDDKLNIFIRSERPQNSLYFAEQNEPNGNEYGQFDQYKDTKIIRSPACATASNGDIYVALVGSDGKLRVAVRRKGGSWKTPYAKLPHFYSYPCVGQPTLFPLADDELGLAVRLSGNYIYFRRLVDPTKAMGWSSYVYSPFIAESDVAGMAQEDGSTVLFVRDKANKLQQATIGPNKYMTWKGGLSSEFEGSPAIGRNSDGRLTVFLIGRTGGDEPVLFMRTQKDKNAPFVGDTDWEEIKGIHVRGTAAVASYANKKLAVFTRADDGKMYLKVQKEADGEFEDYKQLESGDLKFNEDPVVATNEKGTLELFARASDGNLYFTHQKTENGDFEKPQ